ncbi:MAG: hypothetical protein JWM11_1502 [Planctomycetaceae bacterium]|nr:hypothetical protein [Planctomycetaceae bacterium]
MSQSIDSLPRELYRLMSAWADDELTDAEFAQLDTLLKNDVTARSAFAQYVRLCHALPDVVVPAISDRESQSGESPMIRGGQQTMRIFKFRHWILAASVVIAVTGAFWAFMPRPAEVEPPIVAAVEVDSHLAVVTHTEHLVWESGNAPYEIGAAIGPELLRVASGTLVLEFARGVSLRLRGPAEFRLLSTSRGLLRFGELAAHVPAGAEGFTIDTRILEVVDLGTEFGIKVDRDDAVEVHVFRGLVETRMSGGADQPGSLERLSADQTRRFEPGQLKSQVIHFDAKKFPAPPSRYLDEPTTEGAVCLLRQPPKSVSVGTLESDDFILLFQERKDVLLPRPVPISFSLPGRHDQLKGKSGKLKPPLVVDSYLLHFDSLVTSRRESHLRLDGSVTFPRPIVGVIAAGTLLSQTDALFGHPEILKNDTRSRGLDRNAKTGNLDIATLSEDRRTLHVSFSVGGSCDQLRILIEAAKP